MVMITWQFLWPTALAHLGSVGSLAMISGTRLRPNARPLSSTEGTSAGLSSTGGRLVLRLRERARPGERLRLRELRELREELLLPLLLLLLLLTSVWVVAAAVGASSCTAMWPTHWTTVVIALMMGREERTRGRGRQCFMGLEKIPGLARSNPL